MPDINGVTEQNPEQIQQKIAETRSSITDKLEALEVQVRGTVQDAKDTVEDTLQSAKDTVTETVSAVSDKVQDTVNTVKKSLDLSHHVEQYPWPMMGGALLCGLLVGRLLVPVRRAATHALESHYSAAPPRSEPTPPPGPPPSDTPEKSEPGFLDQISDEIGQVKGLAIGYAVGALRDYLKVELPGLAPHLEKLSRSITTKLGGEPVNEPVFQSTDK